MTNASKNNASWFVFDLGNDNASQVVLFEHVINLLSHPFDLADHVGNGVEILADLLLHHDLSFDVFQFEDFVRELLQGGDVVHCSRLEDCRADVRPVAQGVEDLWRDL